MSGPQFRWPRANSCGICVQVTASMEKLVLIANQALLCQMLQFTEWEVQLIIIEQQQIKYLMMLKERK